MPLQPYYRSPLEDLYAPPRPQTPANVPMSPEEEDSLLSKIGGGAMTGLQYAGNVLDKTFGGRAIRGLLGGHPEELASVLPFSDTLGLTDIKNKVSGEDLLKKAGLQTGNETADMILGMGSELALDPATYLSLGGTAITAAGRQAAKLGVLPEKMLGRIRGITSLSPRAAADAARLGIDTSEILGKPLGGVAGFGLPFRDPSIVLGTGPIGEKIAGVLGLVADAAKYSAPGRYASALFDPIVQGKTHPLIQRELRGGHAAELADTGPAVKESVAKLYQETDPKVLNSPVLRQMLETAPLDTPGLSRIVPEARSMLEADLTAQRRAGAAISPLQDQFSTEYFPRQKSVMERGIPTAGVNKPLGGKTGYMAAREDALRDIPGGTSTIEAMLKDPQIAGVGRALSPAAARTRIAEEYLGPMSGQLFDRGTLGTAAEGEGFSQGLLKQLESQAKAGPYATSAETLKEVEDMSFLWDKAKQLSRKLGTEEAGRVGPEGAGLFGNHPLLDLMGEREASARVTANLNAVRRIFTDPQALELGAKAENAIPLTKAIKQAGFSKDARDLFLEDLIGSGQLRHDATTKDLKNLMLPPDLVKQATGLRDSLKATEAVAGPLRALDSVTSLNKAFQTGMWPANWARNFTSGIYQALAGGSNPKLMAEAIPMMRALRSGQDIPGLAEKIPFFKGMSDTEATQELGRMMMSHEAAGRGAGGYRSLVGEQESQALGRLIPGEMREPTLLEALSKAGKGRTNVAGESIDTLGQRFNPLNVAGVGGIGPIEKRNVTQFAPLVAGHDVQQLVDDMTRGPQFIERMMSGYSPTAAGQSVVKRQFDYSALSDFERKVMKRIMPFYSWSRKSIPLVLSDIAQNPGGLAGMGVRAAADARAHAGDFLPGYLGEGLAIPLGGESAGSQKFLTRTDLPFEDPFRYLPTGPQPIQETAMKLAGNLNPLIKAPLEMLAGKQFYSGRSLTDLYGGITGNIPAEQAIMNSPLSRLYTTGRQIADERKSPVEKLINLLTGARVSDVDVNKSRDITIRDLLQEYQAADPKFRSAVDYYVKPEDQPGLNPEEMGVLRLAHQLQKRAQEAAKAK
jgi:hypothetical protein